LSELFRAILAGLALWVVVGPLQGQSRLKVLAEFDQQPDTATVEWMEQEAGSLFSDAALTLSWPPGQDHLEEFIGPLVSAQFHGRCGLDPGALSLPTPGPMAWVQSQDGEIQSFIDVDCDRTAAMVWQSRGTLPLPLVTRAFGRALGRVVAHELYHYLTRSSVHSASDLFRPAMTSRDLTLPQVRFEPGEIEALREGMSRLGGTAKRAARGPTTE